MTTPILSHDREEHVSKPRPAIETLKPEPNRVVEAMEAAAREVTSRMAAAAD